MKKLLPISLICLIFIVFLVSVFIIIIFIKTFWGNGISAQMESWGYFGSFIAGMFGLLSVAMLSGTLYYSIRQVQQVQTDNIRQRRLIKIQIKQVQIDSVRQRRLIRRQIQQVETDNVRQRNLIRKQNKLIAEQVELVKNENDKQSNNYAKDNKVNKINVLIDALLHNLKSDHVINKIKGNDTWFINYINKLNIKFKYGDYENVIKMTKTLGIQFNEGTKLMMDEILELILDEKDENFSDDLEFILYARVDSTILLWLVAYMYTLRKDKWLARQFYMVSSTSGKRGKLSFLFTLPEKYKHKDYTFMSKLEYLPVE
ncbi:putative membrane protein [Providencia alcalifaciens]|nr:putative membrane protein [Providencia alcalifaciens]